MGNAKTGVKYEEVESLRIYQQAEEMADQIWLLVQRWTPYAKDTVGKQLIRSVDSVGANIAEGYGRFYFKENVRFLYIARGSLVETKFWLKRALARNLMKQEACQDLLDKTQALLPQLNAFIGGKQAQNRLHSTRSHQERLIQSPGHRSP